MLLLCALTFGRRGFATAAVADHIRRVCDRLSLKQVRVDVRHNVITLSMTIRFSSCGAQRCTTATATDTAISSQLSADVLLAADADIKLKLINCNTGIINFVTGQVNIYNLVKNNRRCCIP